MFLIKKYILIFFIISSVICYGQKEKNITITFNNIYENEIIKTDSVFYKYNNDSLTISNLKYYISSIVFLNNNVKIFEEKNSYHLIDIRNRKTQALKLKLPNRLIFNQIQFKLGIDSITNAIGIKGGNLDPTNGMYWAWHSGYINFKLEGNSNLCNTRKNAFEFHLGGFQYPYNSIQNIKLDVKNKKNIVINVDIKRFFENVNLEITNQIMTPSNESIKLSKLAASLFSIKE